MPHIDSERAPSMAPERNPKVTEAEFKTMFEAVKTWGQWGADDQRGALNYITAEHVTAAAALIRSGVSVSLALPLNTVAGPDNPKPVSHYMTMLPDADIGSGELRLACDYVGMEFHGDAHSHIDALCHVVYEDRLHNGAPASSVLSTGALAQSIDVAATGIVGRGVLLDIAAVRCVPWLEPGEYVWTEDLLAAEQAHGVELRQGDVLYLRTGHHRRRLELGAWSNDYPPAGQGKAGLHVDTIGWMHERRIAAFLPDGDGETVPSNVEGILYPIHPLQVTAMGMFAADSLQLEDVAVACEEEGGFEFMVVGLPLRLPGGTGSPWNPIAIF
jgi:kynurenine formamidase